MGEGKPPPAYARKNKRPPRFGIRRRTFGFARRSFEVQGNPFARMRFCTRDLARCPSRRSTERERPGILGRPPLFVRTSTTCVRDLCDNHSCFSTVKRSRSSRWHSRLCDLPFVFACAMHTERPQVLSDVNA